MDFTLIQHFLSLPIILLSPQILCTDTKYPKPTATSRKSRYYDDAQATAGSSHLPTRSTSSGMRTVNEDTLSLYGRAYLWKNVEDEEQEDVMERRLEEGTLV